MACVATAMRYAEPAASGSALRLLELQALVPHPAALAVPVLAPAGAVGGVFPDQADAVAGLHAELGAAVFGPGLRPAGVGVDQVHGNPAGAELAVFHPDITGPVRVGLAHVHHVAGPERQRDGVGAFLGGNDPGVDGLQRGHLGSPAPPAGARDKDTSPR